MKMSRYKRILVQVCCALCLCIAAMFTGVYSAKSADVSIDGEIGFEKHEDSNTTADETQDEDEVLQNSDDSLTIKLGSSHKANSEYVFCIE